MIEYCEENIWYKKRKSKKPKRRFFAFIIVNFIIISIFAYYSLLICPKVFNYTKSALYSHSTESINQAVLFSLNEQVNYSDLIHIEKDLNGNISLMTTDSLKVNYISRRVEQSAKSILSNKIKNGVKIPILAFFGLNLSSGYGKEVNFKSLSVQSVTCDFISNFKSLGINQTLHSIYVEVTCSFDCFMPLNKTVVMSKSKILISESVLIGKVPDIYLNGKLFN